MGGRDEERRKGEGLMRVVLDCISVILCLLVIQLCTGSLAGEAAGVALDGPKRLQQRQMRRRRQRRQRKTRRSNRQPLWDTTSVVCSVVTNRAKGQRSGQGRHCHYTRDRGQRQTRSKFRGSIRGCVPICLAACIQSWRVWTWHHACRSSRSVEPAQRARTQAKRGLSQSCFVALRAPPAWVFRFEV